MCHEREVHEGRSAKTGASPNAREDTNNRTVHKHNTNTTKMWVDDDEDVCLGVCGDVCEDFFFAIPV